jgi:hypothetical protein
MVGSAVKKLPLSFAFLFSSSGVSSRLHLLLLLERSRSFMVERIVFLFLSMPILLLTFPIQFSAFSASPSSSPSPSAQTTSPASAASKAGPGARMSARRSFPPLSLSQLSIMASLSFSC